MMTTFPLALLLAEESVYISQAGQWMIGLIAVIFVADRFLSVAVNCQVLWAKKDHLARKEEMEAAFDSFKRAADERQLENRRRLRRIEDSVDELVRHLTGKLPNSLVHRREEDQREDRET